MAKQPLRVKAVIFDLDETLIDSHNAHAVAYARVAEMLAAYLKKTGRNLNSVTVYNTVEKVADRMNRLTNYRRDSWWQEVLKDLGIKHTLPRSLRSELTRNYWEAYASSSPPYSDTMEVLNYLKEKGYRLGLISDTDGTPGMKRRRIDALSFKERFDLIIISGEDSKRTKPDPEPYLLAAERLNLRPEDCVYVGDKPFLDVKGAKRAGMKSILIHRRDWGADDPPDLAVTSLSELMRIL